MFRYCTRCQKEFEVQIKKMEDIEIIHCPFCGNLVDKNSKKPLVNPGETTAEDVATNVFIGIARFLWLIYPVSAVLMAAFYFLKLPVPLYVVTGISMFVFLLQHGKSWLILLPVLSAAAGYYHFKTIEGACLGVAIAWVLWHIFRLIKWAIVSKLIELGNR